MFAPSSTHHLENLFLAFDQLQTIPQPKKESERGKESWTMIKNDDALNKAFLYETLYNVIPLDDIRVSTDNVVAGYGLIANRQFQVGEVIALYPIHALGYAHGREPPKNHIINTKEEEDNNDIGSHIARVVGTSDLVCFQEEANYFGVNANGSSMAVDPNSNSSAASEENEIDCSYTMLDPSGKYVFDVNPFRSNNATNNNNNFFLAHLVNDAAAADFCKLEESFLADRGEDDDMTSRIKTIALDYLNTSLEHMNCIMTPFGPPPLMAYVTIKPVEPGNEFLASYGLDYWSGKVKNDEFSNQIIETCFENSSPKLQQRIEHYDTIITNAVDDAIDVVECTRRYRDSTKHLHWYIRNQLSTRKRHKSWRHR